MTSTTTFARNFKGDGQTRLREELRKAKQEMLRLDALDGRDGALCVAAKIGKWWSCTNRPVSVRTDEVDVQS